MGFAALYPSCEDYCDRDLWLFGEPGLGKVLIEDIRRADPKPPHHYERDAIGERVVFVLMLNKIKPARVGWVERSETHQWTADGMMGFGYRLYPSYNSHKGNRRKRGRSKLVMDRQDG
jgi:hypothetical protein